MKKFVAMTNREYVLKSEHKQPFCAMLYGLDNRLKTDKCPYVSDCDVCHKCMELPAKIHNRWILKEKK